MPSSLHARHQFSNSSPPGSWLSRQRVAPALSVGTRCGAAFALTMAVAAGATIGACARVQTADPTQGEGGSVGTGGVGTGGSGSRSGVGGARGGVGQTITPIPPACDPCTDFPAQPIVDMTGGGTPPPGNAAALLGPANAGGASTGPCLIEPESGSLFPRNWLRPRVHFVPAAGQDLFEIRMQVANQTNDLVVYTTATTWTMPRDLWQALALHGVDRDIVVTVRGISRASFPGAGAGAGTRAIIRIAPAAAEGTIVYWTTSGGSALKGFHVGDETVATILQPSDSSGQCVGCHSSTPDGSFIGFSASPPAVGDAAHVEIRSGQDPSKQPSFLTASAQTLLARVPQHLPTFSRGHWSNGDHVLVVAQSDLPALPSKSHLDWIDLEASSTAEGVGWGELARTGDPGVGPAHPFFSHDGQSLVYASSVSEIRGGIMDHGDLYRIPYGNRKGGKATPIAGASTTQFNEYYPALSDDDELLAFTRAPDGQTSYDNAQSEVFVIGAAGGVPTRIRANDPVACASGSSPGITNSWPKWAPRSVSALGKTYYWVIFSSKRMDQVHPQLYMAGIVKDEFGVTTTPALYLWNQPAGENNHTPAWDVFQIPVVQ